MNILGIGAPELILILMIAIIVAGPKRMIRWAFILGQYIGKLRAMWADVAKVIQAEVDQAGLDVQVPTDLPTKAAVGRMIQQAAKPLADPISKAAREVDQDFRRAQSEVKSTATEVKSAATEVKRTAASTAQSAQKNGATPKPPAAPPPAIDLGTWGNANAPAKSNSATSPSNVPDMGTWGAHGDADVADRP
jgi:Sec-independent protein translocase protein TatA